MADPTEEELRRRIDQLYVINLESRPDRRHEMEAELDRLGLGAGNPLVRFFPAVKPDSAGTFPSIGARGCFMSHLGILQDAHAAGHRAILILEDDAAFTAGSIRQIGAVLEDLAPLDWSLGYLGHRIDAGQMPGMEEARGAHWRRLPPGTRVETTHAIVINWQAFAPLIAYLERMMARPAGDPEGGPMHVDGAYSWFRRDHPELLTLVTPTQYVIQRASKSDIAPPSWKDRIPLLGLARQLKNRLGG